MHPTITIKWNADRLPPFFPLPRDCRTQEPDWNADGESCTVVYPTWLFGLVLGVNARYAEGERAKLLEEAARKVEETINGTR